MLKIELHMDELKDLVFDGLHWLKEYDRKDYEAYMLLSEKGDPIFVIEKLNK